MKILLAVLLALGLGAMAAAQTPKKAPAAKSPTEKAGAKKEEPKIEGVEVLRGERGFLGVQIVNGTFKLNFYDKAKKPTEPDVARAALRWDPKYKVGEERVVLNPTGDGKSLSSPKVIRPPHQFKLYITLIKEAIGEGQSPVSESFVIDFKQ